MVLSFFDHRGLIFQRFAALGTSVYGNFIIESLKKFLTAKEKKRPDLGDSWRLHGTMRLFTLLVLSSLFGGKSQRGRSSSSLVPRPGPSGLLPLPDHQKGAWGRLHQRRLGEGGVEASMRPRPVERFCCNFRSVDRESAEVRAGGQRLCRKRFCGRR